MKNYQDYNSVSIKKASSNYIKYRKEALYWIQQLSGDIWSDYNPHDPGVTILEVLCYSLTELDYKLGFSIIDILASNPKKTFDFENNTLFRVDKIFSSEPVTKSDFRKILIDRIENLNDVWILPCKESYNSYDVHLVLGSKHQKNERDKAKLKVKEILNECSPLGIHFKNILIVENRGCTIKLKIEIKNNLIPEKLIAEILSSLENNLCNPKVKKYSLKDLKAQNWDYSEIYDGPLLQKGFIVQLPLLDFDKSKDVYKFKQHITDIEGVLSVNELFITYKDNEEKTDNDIRYFISEIDFFNSSIEIYIDDKKKSYSKDNVFYYLSKQEENTHLSNVPSEIQIGKFRNIDKYISIKKDFPKVYFSNQNNSRKQFEGFLEPYELFFKQKLNTIASFGDFFNVNLDKKYSFIEKLSRNRVLNHLLSRFSVFFSHKVLYYYDIEQEKKQWLGHKIRCKEKMLQNLVQITSKKLHFSLNSVSALEQELYLKLWILNPPKKPYYKLIDDYLEVDDLHQEGVLESILNAGIVYEKYDVKKSLLKTEDERKFEIILNKQFELGCFERTEIECVIKEFIENYKEINKKSEGFYIISNQYLNNSNDTNCEISIVFSGWSKRFQSNVFRQQVKSIVSELVPAHVEFNCFWLKYKRMKKFEETYLIWKERYEIDSKSILTQNATAALNDFLNQLKIENERALYTNTKIRNTDF